MTASLEIPAQVFVCPYRGDVVPCRGDTEPEYLIVWLYLADRHVTLARLHSLCSAPIRLSQRHSLLSDLVGIEIVPCVLAKDGSADRIIRVSVFADVAESFLSLTPSALRDREPTPGVICGWYWDSETLTSRI